MTQNNLLKDSPTETDHSQPCSDVTTLRSEVTSVWANLKEFKAAIRGNFRLAMSAMGVVLTVAAGYLIYTQGQSYARTERIQETALTARSSATVNGVRVSNIEDDITDIKQSLRRIEDKISQ